MLSGSIGYTSDLTKYVIENSHNSDVIKAQLDDPSNDIFTGLPFHETTGDLTDEEKKIQNLTLILIHWTINQQQPYMYK